MTEPSITGSHPPQTSVLERECVPVLRDLQNALVAVVESQTGTAARAMALQKQLKLDSALAWGVHRTAMSPSVLGAGLFVPGPASMKKFFKHARQAGVDGALVARAEEAQLRFEALVERHADDRGVFNAMIAELDNQGDQRVAYKKQKRAAFRALRYLLGHQAQMMFNTVVLTRGDNDDVDAAILMCEIGVRYFRPNSEHRRQLLVRSPQGALPGASPVIEAINTSSERDAGMSLLLEAPSGGGLSYTSRPVDNGYTAIDLRLSQPGKLGAASYVVGWIERGHLPGARKSAEPANFSFYTTSPTEAHVLDVIVFDDVWDRRAPTLGTYSRRKVVDGRLVYEDEDLLPVRDHVRDLGRGLRAASTPSVPNYAELLARVAAQLKQDPEACRVYRARVDFPILHSYSRLTFEAKA